MFIDTSAFMAMLLNEPDMTRVVAAVEQAELRVTSGLVRLETVMNTATKLNVSVEDTEVYFDKIIADADITIVPITDAISKIAVAAFSRFGKGRGHKAQLNLADCMSYGVAAAMGCPILFIGKDFSRTDLISALGETSPRGRFT